MQSPRSKRQTRNTSAMVGSLREQAWGLSSTNDLGWCVARVRSRLRSTPVSSRNNSDSGRWIGSVVGWRRLSRSDLGLPLLNGFDCQLVRRVDLDALTKLLAGLPMVSAE